MTPATAVVFAYHDVGVRCLKALISAGVTIPLVVTVPDDSEEVRWFGSVAEVAADYGLALLQPDGSDLDALERRIAQLQPRFIFSFYYRSLLPASLLALAADGALNIHGSLLPKYRGRAPVNWAIVNGERETGATLHYMVERADAGDIVDQLAVPILRDDEAREVFAKVTVAAETILTRSLPGLLAGTAARRPQAIQPGQYFGRRRPQDGRIDWQQPAEAIHDLIRAVAPPFPGAFCDIDGERWWVHRSRVLQGCRAERGPSRLVADDDRCVAVCGDLHMLQILSAATRAGPVDLAELSRQLRKRPVMLIGAPAVTG